MEDLYTQSVYHDPNTDAPAPDGAAQYGAEPQDPDAPVSTAGRFVVTRDEHGNEIISTPEGKSVEVGNPLAERDAKEAAKSAVQKRLEAVRAARGSRIITVTFEGEEWHILMFDLGDLDEWALLTSRDGDGTLQIANDQVMRAMQIAALQVAVMKSPVERTPYFAPEAYEARDEVDGSFYWTTEAAEWIDEPAYLELNAFLWETITDLNPSMVPGKKKSQGVLLGKSKPKTKKTPAAKASGPTSSSESTSETDAPSSSPTA